MPLVAGGEVRGVDQPRSNVEREHAFSESDVRLLQTLAGSMSVALENARLFDETQRLFKESEQRAAELAIINSVQEALAAELNIQGIYDAVGDKIREIFDGGHDYRHPRSTITTRSVSSATRTIVRERRSAMSRSERGTPYDGKGLTGARHRSRRRRSSSTRTWPSRTRTARAA